MESLDLGLVALFGLIGPILVNAITKYEGVTDGIDNGKDTKRAVAAVLSVLAILGNWILFGSPPGTFLDFLGMVVALNASIIGGHAATDGLLKRSVGVDLDKQLFPAFGIPSRPPTES